MPKCKDKKISIEELERLLNINEEIPIEITPNGEIRVTGDTMNVVPKPITLRQDIGGEYVRG